MNNVERKNIENKNIEISKCRNIKISGTPTVEPTTVEWWHWSLPTVEPLALTLTLICTLTLIHTLTCILIHILTCTLIHILIYTLTLTLTLTLILALSLLLLFIILSNVYIAYHSFWSNLHMERSTVGRLNWLNCRVTFFYIFDVFIFRSFFISRFYFSRFSSFDIFIFRYFFAKFFGIFTIRHFFFRSN